MLAATMTTTLMMSNAIFYLTQNPEIITKLRSEMTSIMRMESFENLSDERWRQVLLDEEVLSKCSYLGFCINETLRLDPSLRFSTIHEVTDSVTLGGYKILGGQ